MSGTRLAELTAGTLASVMEWLLFRATGAVKFDFRYLKTLIDFAVHVLFMLAQITCQLSTISQLANSAKRLI